MTERGPEGLPPAPPPGGARPPARSGPPQQGGGGRPPQGPPPQQQRPPQGPPPQGGGRPPQGTPQQRPPQGPPPAQQPPRQGGLPTGPGHGGAPLPTGPSQPPQQQQPPRQGGLPTGAPSPRQGGLPIQPQVPQQLPPQEPARPAQTPASNPQEYYQQAMGGGTGQQRSTRPAPADYVDPSSEYEDEPEEEESSGSRFPKFGKKKSSEKTPSKSKKPSKRPASGKPSFRSGLAGGRKWVIAARGLVIVLAVFLMLMGLLSVFRPSNDAAIESQLDQLSASVGYGGFPITPGAESAQRFVTTYFTIPASLAGQKDREETLAQLAPSLPGSSFEVSAPVAQRITEGPFMYKKPKYVGPNNVTYYFAVQLGLDNTPVPSATPVPQNDQTVSTALKPTWMYVAVPMYADDNGALTVAGNMSFLPSPGVAQLGDLTTVEVDDTDFAKQVTDTTLVPFLTDWALSDSTRLDLVLDPDASASARQGLQGTVEFSSIVNVFIPTVETASADTVVRNRTAYVDVVWRQANGILVNQSYAIVMYLDDANEWKIVDIASLNQPRVPPTESPAPSPAPTS